MVVCLKADRLVDCTGKPAIIDAAVVVEEGRITAAGKREEIVVPENAPVYEYPGCTIMPGMIDSHVHMESDARREETIRVQHSQPEALCAIRGIKSIYDDLMCGVTTLRCLGDGTNFIDVQIRDAIIRGEILGPRLLVCGQAIRPTHGTAPELGVTADGVDEMRFRIRETIFHNADVIKLFISNVSRGGTYLDYLKGDLTRVSAYSEAEIAVAVEEAGRCGIKVAAHCIGGDVVQWALRAGVASLEHVNLIREEDIPFFSKFGGFISDPNLILFFDPVHGFESPTQKTHKWNDLPAWWHEKVRYARDNTRRVMNLALKEGVKFALATDLNHTLLWLECKYFVEQIGATNMQALLAVTRDSAELLGLDDTIGTIEEGKCADMICVEGDPLTDISALNKVRMVMKSGTIVKNGSNKMPL